MLTVARSILDVVKSLLDVSQSLRTADRQRRQDMAELFSGISGCLGETSASLRRGEVPHGRCAELLQYAQALPAVVGRELGPVRAEELGRQLFEAHRVEQLAVELGQAADKEPYLAQLDEAAGKWVALASLVRVGD